MNASSLRPLVVALVLGTALESHKAHAASNGADEALTEFRGSPKSYNVVMNRFFLKSNRFELTPSLGYVPNNPFVKRYVGGLMGAYHFTEELAAEGTVMYAPDLGNDDLKDLTHTLVAIAHDSDDGQNFQQPLDKMILGATFAARWAPVYGKLNLIGERVLNFDFYGTAGLGLIASEAYYAKYSENAGVNGNPPTVTEDVGSEAHGNVNVGLGFDFFLTSAIALKLDGRSYFYIDKKPDYDPENGAVDESRLYDTFIATLGLSFYFPSMPDRLQF